MLSSKELPDWCWKEKNWSFWLSRYFCLWGVVWLMQIQMHSAHYKGEMGPKRKSFMLKFFWCFLKNWIFTFYQHQSVYCWDFKVNSESSYHWNYLLCPKKITYTNLALIYQLHVLTGGPSSFFIPWEILSSFPFLCFCKISSTSHQSAPLTFEVKEVCFPVGLVWEGATLGKQNCFYVPSELSL